MTTEAPLTRRQIRERERAQFEKLASQPGLASPQYFDAEPVVLVPPVDVVTPALVLATPDDSSEYGTAQPVTELPVPEAAAPWPEWASRPVAVGSQPAVPEADAFASVQPVPDHLAVDLPAELEPDVAIAGTTSAPAAAVTHAPDTAVPDTAAYATRPRVPVAPRSVAKPLPRAATPVATRAAASARRPVVVKKATKSIGRRVLAKVFPAAALLFAGALLVGSSIPANAFMQNTLGTGTATFEQVADGQSMSVSDAPVTLDGSARDGTYKVVSPAQRLADKYGKPSGAYSPTSGPVRWPFPYTVSTSDGFGPRVAPCIGCSTFHQGLDFLPGNGKPIYAVAAGVVTFHAMDGSLGNKVEVAHIINGKPVESVYAHMQLNSSPLKVGDKVKPGDFIGLVGATGSATAPHLHLEIHLDGVPVDPYAWLTANAS